MWHRLYAENKRKWLRVSDAGHHVQGSLTLNNLLCLLVREAICYKLVCVSAVFACTPDSHKFNISLFLPLKLVDALKVG